MAYEPKDMTGVLFRNDRKQTDRQPDYTGKLHMGGTEYQLAGWLKEGAKGSYLSLKISERQEGRG